MSRLIAIFSWTVIGAIVALVGAFIKSAEPITIERIMILVGQIIAVIGARAAWDRNGRLAPPEALKVSAPIPPPAHTSKKG